MKYLTVSSALRVVTAGLLFFALRKQPYDYFYILRLAVCITSVYLIYVAIAIKNYGWIILSVTLVTLFNPFVYPPIKRETWQIIDVVVAVILLASIFLVGERIPKTQI